ncbi:AAA family ATPase [Streptosporangium sp. NPDC006007]|uniref:McrB family protein n=1 Tax=Streptosporangium sp. NPDC006007 TaxID=3154575 RepID=UPI0033A9CC47
MAATEEIASRVSFTLLQVLNAAVSLRPADAWAGVLRRYPEAETEWERAGGRMSAMDMLKFQTNTLVKCGWLHRATDTWEITSGGRAILRRYPDPGDFGAAMAATYRYWERHQADFWTAVRLTGAIPEGRWASRDDVAALTKINPVPLTELLEAERPDGWRRVLTSEGYVPHHESGSHREWLSVLSGEGLSNVNGQVAAGQRLTADDLRQFVQPARVGRRAWLVRANVEGRNLVGGWLAEGFCSLQADRLQPLPPGVGRDRVHAAVEDGYDSFTYSERNQRVTEFFAFLSQMNEGDLVITNDGPGYRIGKITGPPRFTASTGSLSNLRRAVEWVTSGEPIDLLDLPDTLTAKMVSPYDVVDLTERLADLLALIGEGSTPGSFTLADVSENLADKLLLPRDWLQECVELLRERPQLIFDGPPGTGKTYLAKKLAAHITGGLRENVSLIQFHANYAYEDFFEGYRPGDDGNGGMSLVKRDGPFRLLVTAANQRPEQAFVMIIDEINRCNLPLVFGELYFLLDYRNEPIHPQYSPHESFTLPENVHIIATMNSSDRSTTHLDSAMRRRFWIKELHPDSPPVNDLLRRWLKSEGLPEDAAGLLDRLNSIIPERDFKIGPSLLMRRSFHESDTGLQRAWETQIIPTLRELHIADGTAVAERYGLSALRRRRRP